MVVTTAAPYTALTRRTSGALEGRSKRRRRAQSGRSRANFIIGGLAAIVPLAIFALVLQMGPRDLPSVPQTTDPNWDVVGTITLAPSGAYCRQLALDNNTGIISQLGFIRCIDAEPDRFQATAGPGPTGRLDGIRRSFARH